MSNFNQIKARDKQFFMNTYAPYDIAFVSGKGCTLTDSEGKVYTDFLAGIAVNALGYGHPAFVRAVQAQAEKLTVVSNYFYSEERGLLAERLVEGTVFGKVFFANSGAEANECALKLARKYFRNKGENRYKFVTAADSFHGRTLATVTATGQPKYNEAYAPLPAGFGDYVPYNDIAALETALADPAVAALFIEPVQGEGGVIPATKEYLQAARKLTLQNGQLLIFDEVQTGAGRCGTFWAHEIYGVSPDIMTAAKAIGGGIPIGACLATDAVASAFVPGDHGTTFGASPFACAVSLAVVNEIKKPGFLETVAQTAAYMKNALAALRHPAIQELRGYGMMLGLALSESLPAKTVVNDMLERGFILNACGKNTLRFIPPLVITPADIDNMIAALQEVLHAHL